MQCRIVQYDGYYVVGTLLRVVRESPYISFHVRKMYTNGRELREGKKFSIPQISEIVEHTEMLSKIPPGDTNNIGIPENLLQRSAGHSPAINRQPTLDLR